MNILSVALRCVGAVKNSLYLGELGVIILNNALQSTIVFLRHITAIKSAAAFGCGFRPT